MNEEIFNKVVDVIVAKLEVKAEDVKPESEFGNDLGADSLDRVELVMALEDEFEV
ncbi:MAG: acyl carrier protein, partial [Fibrobacter sp.]|nr:acyl carrier protein [Fibrobacter sp.]